MRPTEEAPPMEDETLPLDQALTLAQQLENQTKAWTKACAVLRTAMQAQSLIGEAEGRRNAIEEEIAQLNQRRDGLRAVVDAATTHTTAETERLSAVVRLAQATSDEAVRGLEANVRAATAQADTAITAAEVGARAEFSRIEATVEAQRAELARVERGLDARRAEGDRLAGEIKETLRKAQAEYDAFIAQITAPRAAG